jgi:hypothetical protein
MATKQFNRDYNLKISQLNGISLLETNKLRLSFEIFKGLSSTPNQCKIIIYNITDNTVKRLSSTQNLDVVLSAGYINNIDVIFKGSIRTVSQLIRENADKKVEMIVGDADLGLKYGAISTTFLGLTPLTNVIQGIINVMPGVSIGIVDAISEYKLPERGYPFTGDCKTLLDALASQYKFSWSVQDGILEIISTENSSRHSTIDDSGTNAYVLSSKTGLIGSPSLEDDGKLSVKALLNPRVKPGRVVNIDSLDFKGFYKILSVTFNGDTRGQEWFMNIKGLSLDV